MQINLFIPNNTVTCRPIAKESADKHVSMHVVSWKPRLRFRGYRCSTGISVDTNDQRIFPWIRYIRSRSDLIEVIRSSEQNRERSDRITIEQVRMKGYCELS
jgi:hypothetical protein